MRGYVCMSFKLSFPVIYFEFEFLSKGVRRSRTNDVTPSRVNLSICLISDLLTQTWKTWSTQRNNHLTLSYDYIYLSSTPLKRNIGKIAAFVGSWGFLRFICHASLKAHNGPVTNYRYVF